MARKHTGLYCWFALAGAMFCATDVHGTVYEAAGAKNPGTNAEGAAIDVSSRSGKSTIYVEIDRAQTSPAH